MRSNCDKCILDKYNDETPVAFLYYSEWIERWMDIWCFRTSMHKPWISDCDGCHGMAISKIKSMMILLDKLGVRLDG
jgi:hypothetical protein